MKKYYLELTFAHKNDGPGQFDKYGMKLTEEDIKNKTYNRTYTENISVSANSLLEAGAKAMIEMHKSGFSEGNYLYSIKIKKLFAE